ncbi:hypothetical protein HY469_03705 [Candidatus Roizmanbacteria bacterium]|nr:hypothetical protein [Candidatus Roizmanbacteria bacterium]
MNTIFHCPFALYPQNNQCRYFFSNTSSGQALAEILFALAIAILLINGLVVAMRSGIANSQFSQHKVQSVHLAQTSIELARAERDNGHWADLNTRTAQMGEGTVSLDNVDFNRDVVVTDINAGTTKRITVIVSWDEYNRQVQTRLTTILTNWR